MRRRSLSGNASRFSPGKADTTARCAADALCGVAARGAVPAVNFTMMRYHEGVRFICPSVLKVSCSLMIDDGHRQPFLLIGHTSRSSPLALSRWR
jgi:hypothetical protein